MNRFRRLVREIHRRSLWQVLAIYGIASWVAIQVVQTLTEALGLPEWFPAFAVVLLIVGLPVVLATAFVQEGIRGSDVPSEDGLAAAAPPGAPHHLFTWRNALGGGVVAFALWGVVATGWMVWGGGGGATASPGDASVAVLPFSSMGSGEEDEFFAAGIHEEIIAELARLRNLKVISRTSVMEYAERTKNLREIAGELGVRMILEGSVRTDDRRVRITAQLIDAETDDHVWAETYDRTLTAGDLFDIQSDIAQAIAARLRVDVSPEERRGIEARPTESLEAYELYLQAEQIHARSAAEPDMRRALGLFRQAAELDPAFAGAHAGVGKTEARLWWYHYDRGRGVLPRARTAIDRALALDPQSPEAWGALGHYHYWGFLDYEQAVEAFERGLDLQPSNSDLHAGLAFVRRRQGRLGEALEGLQRAVELDPRSADLASNLGETYGLLRRYGEAERELERAIALNPTWVAPYIVKARVRLAGGGGTDAALRAREDARRSGATGDGRAYLWVWLHLVAGDPEGALSTLDALTIDAQDDQFNYHPRALYAAWAHELAGRPDQARRQYEEARGILEARVRERPDDARYHSALGLTYAGLGLRDEALLQARLGTSLLPLHREAWRGARRLEDLARVHAAVGEPDEAVAILEELLSIPGELSAALLAVDPAWRPLRGHPGFEALVGR